MKNNRSKFQQHPPMNSQHPDDFDFEEISSADIINLSPKLISLLEHNGISEETAVNLDWKSCSYRKTILLVIPYILDGKVVNYKYRLCSAAGQIMASRSGGYCFFNVDAARSVENLPAAEQITSTVVITHDELDAAVAIQCGYLAIASPEPLLFNVDEEDEFSYLQDFPRLCTALIVPSNDAGGMAFRQKIALRLGWHRCKYIQYPKDCKNLREIFKKYGQSGIDEVLKKRAKFMNQGGLFRMNELPEEPNIVAHDPNIDGLNDMLKIRRGDTIVVTGMPNMGKSLFVNCLAANMAESHAWNICIASFEARPRGALQRYFRKHYIGKPEFSPEGFELWNEQEIHDADNWINRRFSFIVPDVMSDDVTNVKWVLERAHAAITQHDTQMIIIDPWNEIYHDKPMGMNANDYTGYALQEIKRTAARYMVTPLIVGHPRKPDKNKDGQYDVPTLYDMSDSSHWYNKPDIGIVVHMLEGEAAGDRATMVRVAKIRDWDTMGRKGDAILKYHPNTGRYSEYVDFVAKVPASKSRTKKEKTPDESQTPVVQQSFQYKDD